MSHISYQTSDQRFFYTIQKLAETGQLWVLGNQRGFMSYETRTGIVFPFWPSREFAQSCQTDSFRNSEPETITIAELLEDYLPEFEKERYKLAIFPLPNDPGMPIEISVFKKAVE